jgi:membrane-bound lytic murein transglycosylase D
MRLTGWLLIVPVLLYSCTVAKRYPGYSYVFSEFDVDRSYICDPSFEGFVHSHEKELKRFYERSIKRGEGLLSMVRGELMEDGLSDLFLYLSIIESGLSTDIASSKKAVGLWQFMPKTARHYRLEVCNTIDERCDPFVSTKAAIRYLKALHKRFGKWYLAAMAYNCGEGRLQKAIARAGTDELRVLLDPQEHYLPAETRDYIRKILLVAMIGEETLIDFPSQREQNSIMQVRAAGGTELSVLAECLGMDLHTLKALNRKFRNGKLPLRQREYAVVIPEEKLPVFYLKCDIRQPEAEIKPYLLSHTVILGDTLDSIAQKYHSSSEAIRMANHLEEEYLEEGSILVIPIRQEDFERSLERR